MEYCIVPVKDVVTWPTVVPDTQLLRVNEYEDCEKDAEPLPEQEAVIVTVAVATDPVEPIAVTVKL